MTLTDDDLDLAEQLKRSVLSFPPDGPGPDLALVRRGGARRRRRRQAAVVSGLAVMVAVGSLGGIGLRSALSDRHPTGYASQNPRTVSDPTGATAVMHAALDGAGIAHPNTPAGEMTHVDVGGTSATDFGWSQQWTVSTISPQVTVEFAVYPHGDLPPSSYPCVEPSALSRACTDQTLSDGVRIIAGESSGNIITDADGRGARRAAMWSPTAIAIYPDGRQVVLTVGLSLGQPNPPGVAEPVYEYSAGITLDQIRSAVSSPDLTILVNK